MTRRTAPAVHPAPQGATAVEDLLDRAGDLKGELVAFAQGPRFARRLDALLVDAADPSGGLDEGTAVLTLDHFALQHRLSDGRTVVERFVAERRPRLSDEERAMLLGWRDVVEGCFEVRGTDGDAVELHNLLDDVVYRVRSTMGRTAFAPLRTGMFVLGRIVPIHLASDAWLVSGHLAAYPKTARRQIAQLAANQVASSPELLRRNPALLQRAWEIQAEQRSEFVAQVGADLVVLPPREAQEALREHYRRLQRTAVASPGGRAARRTASTGPLPEDLGGLPDDLLDADSVALVHDAVEGLTFYRDFGRLDALFADPTPPDRAALAQLREYLADDSVSPLAIRRLVERHPDGADPVFRALLRKPDFSWSRDGEELLRRRKKSFVDREPAPGVSVIGERLAELLRTSG